MTKDKKRYAMVYDLQTNSGYSLFSFDSESYESDIEGLAVDWSFVRHEDDYKWYLYEKYGDEYYETSFADEAEEFEHFLSHYILGKNAYFYLHENDFRIYEISQKLYDDLNELHDGLSRFKISLSDEGILHELKESLKTT